MKKTLIPKIKIIFCCCLINGSVTVEQSNNPGYTIIKASPLEKKEEAPLIWGTRSTDTYEEIKKQMAEETKAYNLSIKRIKMMLLMGHGINHKKTNNYKESTVENQEKQSINFAMIYFPMFTPKIYSLSQKIEEKWIVLEEEFSSNPSKENHLAQESFESEEDQINKITAIKNQLTSDGWEPELCAKSIYSILATIKKIYHGLNEDTTIDNILAMIGPFSDAIIDWEIQ